jgi:hypothetical protein
VIEYLIDPLRLCLFLTLIILLERKGITPEDPRYWAIGFVASLAVAWAQFRLAFPYRTARIRLRPGCKQRKRRERGG